MPIQYDLPPRTVLLCDYSKGGFREPEMVKRRPVVIVSPRLRHRSGLVTVVPLSTTAPARIADHHCQITLLQPLPGFPALSCWAKADMVATVGFDRLDMFRTDRDQTGKRKYLMPQVSPDDFARIKDCIRAALGL